MVQNGVLCDRQRLAKCQFKTTSATRVRRFYLLQNRDWSFFVNDAAVFVSTMNAINDGRKHASAASKQ
jgi:hypothetical protein